MVTTEELIKAINDAGITAAELVTVLKSASILVTREKLRASIEKTRLEAQTVAQQYEATVQALQAQFDAANKEV
jgi:hypothetical protein